MLTFCGFAQWLKSKPKLLNYKQILQTQNSAEILPKTAIEQSHCYKPFFMYKVVSECNNNEVWASGFYSKDKAKKRIDEGCYHKFMYDDDKNKKLIIIEYGKN